MKRVSRRIEAAIERASRRLFGKFYLTLANGARIPFDAVKKNASQDDYSHFGEVSTSTRVEFVVGASTFRVLKRAALESTPGASTALAAFRGARVEQATDDGVLKYALDAGTPFQENSPEGGSVRLFGYMEADK